MRLEPPTGARPGLRSDRGQASRRTPLASEEVLDRPIRGHRTLLRTPSSEPCVALFCTASNVVTLGKAQRVPSGNHAEENVGRRTMAHQGNDGTELAH